MYNNELYHHGRLGQKWGQRNGPPYPLSRGKVHAIYGNKPKRGLSGYLERRRLKKALKVVNKAAKEYDNYVETEEEKKARHDAAREKALREGTASEVLKYRTELTNDELSKALNRIRWTNDLAKIAKEESEVGWKTIDSVMDKIGDLKNWTRTGVDFYRVLNEAIDLANKKGK